MKLLIKIASRERPYDLWQVLNSITALHGDGCETRVLVSCDDDDTSTKECQPVPAGDFGHYAVEYIVPIDFKWGPRVSKIEAINRDVAAYDWPWDVVLVLADDMEPVIQNFDSVVLQHFRNLFPDTDGELFLSDGRQSRLNTIQCMGRKRWESMNQNIYHPSYHSYWCDNEAMEVAQRDGKLCKIEGPMFMHLHPMYGKSTGRSPDALLKRNQMFKTIDRKNYLHRKSLGFPL